MDGGGDNQLAVRSFGSQRDAFYYYARAPVQILQVPSPDQEDGSAAVLHLAVHALFFAELAEDSGFESGSEGD
ncbi:uncharacterized protein LOC127010989 [Drosophila biarmipes]|uniref:uncharacterized protein LOC127010989 n=1 Tax=Drosophila biarmipes TaxID=125945 RepID=UPI0007E7DA7F|nr:uncharacterized protein LOC127010989 [Drosophila biarmipes]XP_050743462.1 uncharacterized protein LOC127010989 [Drosophila biarmipes]